jgi:hypothetical protein
VIQRDHPVNSILGDIHKGVTTRSRVAHFCEHYSFVFSTEPYMVEDALRDSDWVLVMQEELDNFTRNELYQMDMKLPFSMDQSRKRSMLSNLLTLKIVSNLTMYIERELGLHLFPN